MHRLLTPVLSFLRPPALLWHSARVAPLINTALLSPDFAKPKDRQGPQGRSGPLFLFLNQTASFQLTGKSARQPLPATGLCYRLASSLGKSLLFFAPPRPRSSRSSPSSPSPSSRYLGFPGITACTATGGVAGTGSSRVSS